MFDTDDIDGGFNFPGMNFDNEWDRIALLSVPFPRAMGANPVEIIFEITTINTTAWYIGVVPEGIPAADTGVDANLKFVYAWHYFFGANAFFTFDGPSTWANQVSSS